MQVHVVSRLIDAFLHIFFFSEKVLFKLNIILTYHRVINELINISLFILTINHEFIKKNNFYLFHVCRKAEVHNF